MRAFLFLACLMVGPLGMPAGSPNDKSASRIPDRKPAVHLIRDEASLVTDAQVQEWIGKWQKRLDLEEWTIVSRVVRASELPPSAVANIHWSLPRQRATLRVLSSVDSSLRLSEIPRDTELSVVHELIHLSMARLPLDPNHTELEEETVKRISSALLNLEDEVVSRHAVRQEAAR